MSALATTTVVFRPCGPTGIIDCLAATTVAPVGLDGPARWRRLLRAPAPGSRAVTCPPSALILGAAHQPRTVDQRPPTDYGLHRLRI